MTSNTDLTDPAAAGIDLTVWTATVVLVDTDLTDPAAAAAGIDLTVWTATVLLVDGGLYLARLVERDVARPIVVEAHGPTARAALAAVKAEL